MRLIDTDKFRMRLAAAAFLNGTEEAAEKANIFMKLLDMEETAYDVDKVVEQLEIKSRGNWGFHSPIELEDAVDIVTSGGLEKRSSENN